MIFQKSFLSAFTLTFLVSSSAIAQQTTGTPGSPSSTIAIDGKQLPPPDPKFGGVIKDDALQSKPWWAPRVVPPKGAPNVLLIITDDSGFGVPSTFGGVIPTPAMDRLAKNGLRYNNIHSTALCSPTRMGFEYFYGFVGGDANQWQPNLFRNTTQIYPFEGKPGWNLVTGMADDAIDYMNRMHQIQPD